MSYFKAYLMMATGIFLSIALLVFVDIQISLAKIDENDPSTWPNMGPQIRYYFIPIIFLPVLLFSMLVTAILERIKKIEMYEYWFSQGLSYGLIVLFFPLIRFGLGVVEGATISALVVICAVTLIRKSVVIENAL